MGTSLYRSTLLSTGGFSVSDYIRKFTKNKPDVNNIQPNVGFCHQSTQTSQQVKEVISAELELQQPEVTLPNDPSSQHSPEAHTGASEPLKPVSAGESSKALQKAKEISVKSSEPTHVQTFAPAVHLEQIDVHNVPKQETNSLVAAPADAKCVIETMTKVEKDIALQQERALERADDSHVANKVFLKSIIPGQQLEKIEDPQQQAEVSLFVDEDSLEKSVPGQHLDKKMEVLQKQAKDLPVVDEDSLNLSAPGQRQLEEKVDVPEKAEKKIDEAHKKMEEVPRKDELCIEKPVIRHAGIKTQHEETMGMETTVPKHDESKCPTETYVEKTENKNADVTLESDKIMICAVSPQNTSLDEDEKSKAAPLRKVESTLLIIDDSPPLPAPFDHRIVSAKQVPINSYYAVNPVEVLGGGRFGQVHKCAELSSGLTLAAKIIKVRGMKERDEVKNEIGVMNQLNHVNLIQLYDAFESRTNLTLIMEYVEGGELFERIIDESYQLTELDAIVFTRQICEGVQYLHQQYILHLDLKPENILCVNSTGNQIKIIDFGLARKYRPREKLKVNFGTPEFLAPEVVNYDFVSFPTDMWSVGVITYMLLSGLSPFMGDNDAETMNNILHAKWEFDTEAFENVSEEAKDFISSLLVSAKCSRLSASGCMKHSWLNNLEDKAKMYKVRLKSQMMLQRYLVAHRQWKKHFYAVAAANRLKRFQQSRSISTPN
ncbi:myosin light chain kinase 3 [Danio rerio]|uniref:Myosin light chain kinase 3 n=1 Tax=Danio rerio TaxID=7955 RepID=MYLK3_DANRE|nr:myosin light chain kinase 3 [Danio rerio]A8C984.1 RecName: Full=Myosin light chain kinase 3; AltName: Full=Cardiac-MyBP-C-associated Ca/CaM kinase; Short=Cardiac-MLCK [Danio rerio]BAF80631.1 cardiac myosin light chain kinase [Danio rerio]|eukprot:NP_001099057.1 myosin light chain kinase 3 [Danio rerio]